MTESAVEYTTGVNSDGDSVPYVLLRRDLELVTELLDEVINDAGSRDYSDWPTNAALTHYYSALSGVRNYIKDALNGDQDQVFWVVVPE